MFITLSSKQYALNKVYLLNKQVSKHGVMARLMVFFSSWTCVLAGYGFVLSCTRVMHLALLDHLMSDYA